MPNILISQERTNKTILKKNSWAKKMAKVIKE